MATWIIAYNQNGNTSMLKVKSEHCPDLDEAVDLLTQKAEQDYEELDFEPDLSVERTPALLLVERFGITVAGIAQC